MAFRQTFPNHCQIGVDQLLYGARPGVEESMPMKIRLHQNDLPAGLELGPAVAIDTETLGLNPGRDRLCLVQLSSGDDSAHLVQFRRDQYAAPNLKRLLADPKVLKLYH